MDSNTASAAKAVSRILIQLDDFPVETKQAILRFVEHLIMKQVSIEFGQNDPGDEFEIV